jgi:hypothetical protein
MLRGMKESVVKIDRKWKRKEGIEKIKTQTE